MDITYLEKAKERINNVPLLINMVSRRVKQLNAGQRPLVKPDSQKQQNVDIALKEIAEGKLQAEMSFTAPPAPAQRDNILAL
jgi:DNA-directed RNA polymerase subunit omega